MLCKMELDQKILEALYALRNGFNDGDFGDLRNKLPPDCVLRFESGAEEVRGSDAVAAYFADKAREHEESGVAIRGSIAELTGIRAPGNGASRAADRGKPCLELWRRGEDVYSIPVAVLEVSTDGDGRIEAIDEVEPRYTEYYDSYMFVGLYPSSDPECENLSEQNTEHLISVSEEYLGFLYMFTKCAGIEFDEYAECNLEMKDWLAALKYWRTFSKAETFDAAFETIAGIDYAAGTVGNPDAAREFGNRGKVMWENRRDGDWLLEALVEWTDLYKDRYPYVNTLGY